MHTDLLNTLFALVFAVAIIAIFWNMIMYFAEIGSEEGKKEYKGLLVDSVSWFVLILVIFALVSWVRSLIGI